MGWLRVRHDRATEHERVRSELPWLLYKIQTCIQGIIKGSKVFFFFFFLTLFRNNIKHMEKLQKQYKEVLILFILVSPNVNILSHLHYYIFFICIYCCCLFTRLCLTLCTPWTVAWQVSQASLWEWVAIFFSRGSSQPTD